MSGIESVLLPYEIYKIIKENKRILTSKGAIKVRLYEIVIKNFPNDTIMHDFINQMSDSLLKDLSQGKEDSLTRLASDYVEYCKGHNITVDAEKIIKILKKEVMDNAVFNEEHFREWILRGMNRIEDTLESISKDTKHLVNKSQNDNVKRRNAFLLAWDLFAILTPHCRDKMTTYHDIKARLKSLGVTAEFPNPLDSEDQYSQTFDKFTREMFAEIRANNLDLVANHFALAFNALLNSYPDRDVSFSSIWASMENIDIPQHLKDRLLQLESMYSSKQIPQNNKKPMLEWANLIHDYFLSLK